MESRNKVLVARAQPLLRAWRKVILSQELALVLVHDTQLAARKRCAKATFDSWSKRVPMHTRQWARLFSKLDFEHHRQAQQETGYGNNGDAGSGGAQAGVAKLFGAKNAKELRKVFKDFMRDLSVEEREEMRFVLHAEAIRRGLGRYSVTARRAVGRQSLR